MIKNNKSNKSNNKKYMYVRWQMASADKSSAKQTEIKH